MNLFRRSAVALSFTCALALTSAVPLAASPSAWYQEGDWHHHLREIVDRTQNDLTAALQIATGPKDHERYRHAQRTLSDFDRKLSRGRFDEAKALFRQLVSAGELSEFLTIPGYRLLENVDKSPKQCSQNK
jgi:hypothetical protein